MQELLTHFELGCYVTERPVTSSSLTAGGFILGKDWAVQSSPDEWLTTSLKKGQVSRIGIDGGALLPDKEVLHLLLRNIGGQGVITYMLEPTVYMNSKASLDTSPGSIMPLQ